MARHPARRPRAALAGAGKLLFLGIAGAAAAGWWRSRSGEGDLDRRTADRLRPPGAGRGA